MATSKNIEEVVNEVNEEDFEAKEYAFLGKSNVGKSSLINELS